MNTQKVSYYSPLQNKLIGALIGLARASVESEDKITKTTDDVIIESLCATNTDDDSIHACITRIEEEKRKLIPLCYDCASPCGKNNAYDMELLWSASEDIRALKALILFNLCELAYTAKDQNSLLSAFFRRALFTLGFDHFKAEDFLPLVIEMGKMKLSLAHSQ